MGDNKGKSPRVYFFPSTKWNVVAILYWLACWWTARDYIFILKMTETTFHDCGLKKYLHLLLTNTWGVSAWFPWLQSMQLPVTHDLPTMPRATDDTWRFTTAHAHKKKRKKNSKGCATRYSVCQVGLPHLRWLSITPRAPLWEFAPRATRLTSSQLPLKPLQQHMQAVTFVTSRRREWYFMVFHTVTSRTHVRAHTLRFR